MIRVFVLVVIIFGSVGCNACRRLQHCTDESCAPVESCPAPATPQGTGQSTLAPAPAPAAPQPAPTPAAAQSAPAAPAANPQSFVQPQQGMMQQGMMMGNFAQPQMMMPAGFMQTAPQFNMQGATVTTSPGRTRLAFSLSTIKIPLPWIKATPVVGPQEITMHVPAPQLQQPAMVPQMFFQGQPQMMMQPQMPMPYMVGQGQMMPGMQGSFMGNPQGIPGNFAQAAPQGNLVCPPCPPNTGVTPERVQKLTAQILELEQQLKATALAAPSKEAPKDGK